MSSEPKLNPVAAIIFDFGGVLLDWNPRYLYRKIFVGDPQAMERFFIDTHFEEWNLELDAGRPFSEAVEEGCRRYPQYYDQIRAYDTRWEESLGGEIRPSIEILRQLKQARYALYGFSNWSAEKFYLVRPHYAFMDWFDSIVLSGEEKLNKPDPRIFEVLLKRVGRPAAECLLVDDSLKNTAVARQLGLQAIHFQSPEQLNAELQKMGVLNNVSTV
jgi:2-haloacid dehalogenase